LSENYLKIKYILKIWSIALKLNYHILYKPSNYLPTKIVTTWILGLTDNLREVPKNTSLTLNLKYTSHKTYYIKSYSIS
jgi:hypothetical protein